MREKSFSLIIKKLLPLLCAVSMAAAMTLVSQAAAVHVNVTRAAIQGANVVVTAQATGLPATDDGMYHLIAQEVYQSGVTGVEVAQAPVSMTATFTFPLNKNTPSSNLYKKFKVAVRYKGALYTSGSSCYILNPEASATHTTARISAGKKGILPSPELLDSGGLRDLGISQCTYNLRVSEFFAGGGVNYTYNGKNYSFNSGVVTSYDILVKKLNSYGISVTMILLNNLGPDQTLIHPLSRGAAGSNYYAFNVADQTGVDKIEALASFLAERYSGTGNGTIDNWIIGNEVNARQLWNYMQPVDLKSYTTEYAKTLRLFYNAIKSQNANARVYAAVDQQFAVPSNASIYYGGKPMLESLSSIISSEGNIDWGVSVHPYNTPLYEPRVWAPNGKVTHSQNSPYVTMANIEVLTDFMCTPAMLSPSGQVRSIICSEEGYTSSQGQELQAASIVFGYKQAMANQHIDAFIITREKDAPEEVAQGLAYGLKGVDGSPKTAYGWYKAMGTPQEPVILQNASAIIGKDINTMISPR